MKIPTLRRSLSVLLIFIALIAAYQAGFTAASRSSGRTPTINQWAIETTCTYLIFTDGTNTYGQNCDTGAIDYGGPSNLGGATGTLPETVINLAIAHGGKIFIKAGTYTFTTTPINLQGVGAGDAAIGTTSVASVELYGEGNSTILRAGPNMNGAIQVIGVLNGNNWYIHDLQVDGNLEHNTAEAGLTGLTGIMFWTSNNVIIERCYVHDDKDFGIDIERGISDKILNNHIVDSDANGIIVDGGSNYLIQGNTEDGSSDVGISISGTNAYSGSLVISNVICTGNTVENPSLGLSPFGSNAAIGIQIGDNGFATHVVVSGNQLYGGLVGIGSLPSSGTNLDILISANQVNGTTNEAIVGEMTSSLSIEDNVVDNGGANALLISSTVTDGSISGNHISASNIAIYSQTPKALLESNHIEGGSTGISAYGQQTNIVGNTISNPTYTGIDLDSGSDDSLVVSNYIYTSIAWQTSIYVHSRDDTVSNNRVYGGGGNDGGISIANTAARTFVTDNDIRNNTYPISNSGISTVITGNAGYNPVGNIASPFVSSSKTILDSGGSSTPVNATTMAVWESPKIISVLISSAFTTGHTFVLQIDGTQIVSIVNPAAQSVPYIFTLQPGETFYCQYQTGKVTFVVSGQ